MATTELETEMNDAEAVSPPKANKRGPEPKPKPAPKEESIEIESGADGAEDDVVVEEPKPDLVEVKVLRDYVPRSPRHSTHVHVTDKEQRIVTQINEKERAGTVISLPRDEARWAIREGIAAITADLI